LLQSVSQHDEAHAHQRRVWGSILRLAAVGAGLGIIYLGERHTGMLRMGMAAYLLISAIGCYLAVRNVAPTVRAYLFLVLDIAAVTAMTYGLGTQSATVVVFYVPLLLGYALQRGLATGTLAICLSIGAYGMVLLLEHLGAIPHAPLLPEELKPLGGAGGPLAAFGVVTLCLVATYVFLVGMLRRIDRYGEVKRELEVAEQRSKLQAQIADAQRFESLGRLAGGVSHDFNNILTAIGGYASLLGMRFGLEDDARDQLKEIEVGVARASALTHQLLAFSRRQIVQAEVVDVNSVILSTVRMLERLVGSNIELVTDLSDRLRAVKIDQSQLEQILMNLAVNARDAMPDGGRIMIVTRNALLREEDLEKSWLVAPGPFVMLLFSDNGCGMSEDVRSQIFEPFFTTKQGGHGTGLGLATVFGIVKQYGGDIRVDSEPGEGTTFSVFLPKHRTTAELALEFPDEAEVGIEDAPTPGNETILFAEDDSAVRRLTTKVLEQQGYRVLTAEDGENAELVSHAFEGHIDLLLSDVMMPGITGPELAERLRADGRRMPALFVSGYTSDEIDVIGNLQEQEHFLQKPFSPKLLLARIREILDDRSTEGQEAQHA